MESPISIRIPDDVLQKIDAEGKRGNVINRILRSHYFPIASPADIEAAKEAGVPYIECRNIRAVTKKEVAAAVAARLERVGHDPKTCRIYKCGMCAAVKA
jgi:hypothetical protein